MRPNDFGPIYAETDLSRFPVEPWNAASNGIFLFIIVYFALRTKLDFKRYTLLVSGLPILAVGFIGGSVFHATRSANIWLLLDFLPILILSAMTALYFWRELTGNWVRAVLCLLVPIVVARIAGAALLPRQLFISLNYGILGAVLLFPIFICAFKEEAKKVWLLFGALGSFGFALAFRILDSVLGTSVLPMGTHFLWHLFGGLSVFLLMRFIFENGWGALKKSG